MGKIRHDLDYSDKVRASDELEKAQSLIGGRKATADAIGYYPESLDKWKDSGVIPAYAAKQIDKLTDDYVELSKLRPDLWEESDEKPLSEASIDEIEFELFKRNKKGLLDE
jgi:DNA-binding transcriptional regulator YdaS (Cro superfamily)